MTHSAVATRSEVDVAHRARAVGDGLAGRWYWPANGAILAVQALACILLLRRSYFFAEDFTFLQIYDRRTLDGTLLRESIFGHLIPGFIALNKYFGDWFGANWTAAAILTLAVQLGGTVAFARLMTTMLGRRWWIPAVVAAFGLSLVGLNTTPWWAATTTIQIALAACVSTWGCALRYVSTRRARHLVSLMLMYGIALAFWEKSLATCAYLGLFALIVGLANRSDWEASTWSARFRSAVNLWPVWTLLATLSAIDLLIYVRGPYLDAAGQASGPGETLLYLVRNVTEGLAPALWGLAPPNGSASTNPLLWIVPSLLLLGIVVWTAWRSGLARRAWLWFAVADLCSQILVARGRVRIMGIDETAHELRYQLDPTYLLLIALAVAVPSAVHASGPSVRRRATGVALAVAVVVTPVWAHSLKVISDRSPGTASHKYFAQIRAGDYPPGGHFLDLPVPPWIVPANMYPWNMSHAILPLVRPGLTVTHDPTSALGLGLEGEVGPIVLEQVPGTPSRSNLCVTKSQPEQQLVAASGPRPADAPTPILRFDYQADESARARLLVTTPTWAYNASDDRSTFTFEAPGGTFASALRQTEDWTGVTIRLRHGRSLCLSNIQYVTPVG
jgi:hypothetical protein